MARVWENKMISEYNLIGKTLIFNPTCLTMDKEFSRDLKRDILLAGHYTKYKNIILELSAVEQYEHYGISAIHFAYRQTHLKHGKCVLVKPTSELTGRLKQLESDKWFNVTNDIEEAMNLINNEMDIPSSKEAKPS